MSDYDLEKYEKVHLWVGTNFSSESDYKSILNSTILQRGISMTPTTSCVISARMSIQSGTTRILSE